MIQLAYLLLGLVAGLLALSATGSHVFITLAMLYGLVLYALFNAININRALAFLVGLTIALETLNDARFGAAVALAILLYAIQQTLGKRLRLIPRFARFVLSLIVVLFLYALLLFPLNDLYIRLLDLIIPYLVLLFITYLFHSFKTPSGHELV